MLKFSTLALVATGLLVSGCATTQFNGFSNAPLAQVAIVQNPDINGGNVPVEAVNKITYYSTSCQSQIHSQVAGAGQSAINGAVPGAVATAAGVAGGARVGFSGAASTYLPYGAAIGAMSGANSGLLIGSASAASGIGECTKQFWDDAQHDKLDKAEGFEDKRFKGTHVVPVSAGKAWGAKIPKLESTPKK